MANGDGWIVKLGRTSYLEVLDLQRTLAQLRHEDQVVDILLVVEHTPVITLGRRGNTSNILASPEELSRLGIPVHRVERGGDVTYHGPGQLVVYPIIHLGQRHLSLRRFVHLLEETVIMTLADFAVEAGRDQQHRGVWVADLKIAALGVAIRRWVSFHGLALNVSPDLNHYDHINPCTLKPELVTSMERILGKRIGMEEVRQKLVHRFIELFPGDWREVSASGFMKRTSIRQRRHSTDVP
jgi:lipoate-protein ligase B